MTAMALLVSGLTLWAWQIRQSRDQEIQKIVGHSFSILESAELTTVSKWNKILALSGRTEDALEVTRKFKDPTNRGYLLGSLALFLLQLSHALESENPANINRALKAAAEQAVVAAYEIDDPMRQYKLLAILAVGFAESKIDQLAEEAAESALALAPTLGSPSNQYKELTDLIEKLVRVGMAERAGSVAKSFEDPILRCFALISLAEGHHRVNNLGKAQKFATEALTAAHEIVNDDFQSHAYRSVALMYAGIDHDEAIDVSTAFAITDWITDTRDRDSVLERVAWRRSKDGDIDLEKVLRIEDKTESPEIRHKIFIHSIPVLYKMDLVEISSKAMWRALFDAITNRTSEIPEGIIEEMGEFSSSKAISEAFAIADQEKDPYTRYEIYYDLMVILRNPILTENDVLALGRKLCDLTLPKSGDFYQIIDRLCLSESAMMAQNSAHAAALKIREPERHAEALKEIAMHLVSRGQIDAAFDVALAATYEANLLPELTQSLRDLEKTKEARHAIEEIYSDALEIGEPQRRAAVEIAVARSHDVLGDERASSVRNVCLESAKKSGDSIAIEMIRGELDRVDASNSRSTASGGSTEATTGNDEAPSVGVTKLLEDVAKLARSGDYRKARLAAINLPTEDQILAAYTGILRELAIKKNPNLAR